MKENTEDITFQLHAHAETLIKPARRALLPRTNGHMTIGTSQANIVLLVLHSALEEPFTALAGEDPVMEPGDPVPADGTGPAEQLLPRYPGWPAKPQRVLGQVSQQLQAAALVEIVAGRSAGRAGEVAGVGFVGGTGVNGGTGC